MDKKKRDQLQYKLGDAQIQIERSIRYLKNDGTNQIPEAHLILINKAIAQLQEVKKILLV